MKKLLLTLVAALMSATMSFAQNTLVATLTHGDEITMFYGTYAFQQAHNAAVDGDVINLSGGGFQAVKITKAITIRGTGIHEELPTTIIGSFDIEIPSTVAERINIEGCKIPNSITIKSTIANACFQKCSINNIYNSSSGCDLINCSFLNCDIYAMTIYGKSDVMFLNSFVDSFINSDSTTASATFLNCNIHPRYNGYDTSGIKACQMINCILFNDHSNTSFYSLSPTNIAWNCVAIGKGNTSVFSDMSTHPNCSAANADILKTNSAFSSLTDEAKATYLGTDGTPVGMHGGVLPYNMTPSYPRITKMNVANKTTADGKLSVEIEVSAAE